MSRREGERWNQPRSPLCFLHYSLLAEVTVDWREGLIFFFLSGPQLDTCELGNGHQDYEIRISTTALLLLLLLSIPSET